MFFVLMKLSCIFLGTLTRNTYQCCLNQSVEATGITRKGVRGIYKEHRVPI